jgi:hypothetical protein
MGLDMYLNKKVYVGAEYEHRNVKGKIEITSNGEPINVDFKKVSEIIERVAYWRKANHIHAWFVKNCQKGVDDCRETYVPQEKLKDLLDVCEKIKKDEKLAGELLPPQEGFFFGTTQIDEWYMADIDYTIKELKKAIEDKDCEFYYRSSW